MLAKGSIPVIAIPLILAIIMISLSVLDILTILFTIIGALFLVLAIVFAAFFRDPEREVGTGIVSPADGYVEEIDEGPYYLKISIVMGLRNVHVNRAPMEGRILKTEHQPGKHKIAYGKDHEYNERFVTEIETEIGKIGIVQIAGAFARRIVPYIYEGETLSKGERIGIIRFGSRVDSILPKEKVKLSVAKGSKVKAAESSLATVISDED